MIIRLVREDGVETLINGKVEMENSQLRITPAPVDDLTLPTIVLSNPKLVNFSNDFLLELEAIEPLGSGTGKLPTLYKVFIA